MAGCIRHIEVDPTCPACRPDYEQGMKRDTAVEPTTEETGARRGGFFPEPGTAAYEETTTRAELPDPVTTAEQFALTLERDDREGERSLRAQQLREQTSVRLAAVWGPAVALIFLGFFGMLATITYCITTEHDHEHAKQVTVWCYADPNSNDATSQATGTAADMRDFCPNYPR